MDINLLRPERIKIVDQCIVDLRTGTPSIFVAPHAKMEGAILLETFDNLKTEEEEEFISIVISKLN
eukprot:Awhi_evm1s14645